MHTRTAQATRHGDLKSGQGTVRSQMGAVEGAYWFPSRFEDGQGTNPEELIGAAGFRWLADETGKGCPVSRTLAGVDITVEVELAG